MTCPWKEATNDAHVDTDALSVHADTTTRISLWSGRRRHWLRHSRLPSNIYGTVSMDGGHGERCRFFRCRCFGDRIVTSFALNDNVML